MPTVEGGPGDAGRVKSRGVIGERSVAFWTVVSGVCAVLTMVVGGAAWGWTQLRGPDRHAAAPSPSTLASAHTPGVATGPSSPEPSSTIEPPRISTQSPFAAQEVKYLANLKPVNEYAWFGTWADTTATVNNTTYTKAITTSTCGYDLYREYLVKRQYRFFKADVGIADNTEDAVAAEVQVLDEKGEVLQRATVQPGEATPFEVPIDDVLRLRLVVKEWGCGSRIVVWGDPRIER
ncbi:NPCBM/NEW2 domain-containing protein [Hamadaea sp. NPDC050747]|uniref:NPCBM/NEW2 domain-containing protein n=1 Tax=Hamadaea sp. NPDC050747 TaxID=3155789 RepID=UPI0033EC0A0E